MYNAVNTYRNNLKFLSSPIKNGFGINEEARNVTLCKMAMSLQSVKKYIGSETHLEIKRNIFEFVTVN